MFVGAHERQLDDKGRVALPATYRAHLGEHCYLVKGTDKCVEENPAWVVPELRFCRLDRPLDIDRKEQETQSLTRVFAIAPEAMDEKGRKA